MTPISFHARVIGGDLNFRRILFGVHYFAADEYGRKYLHIYVGPAFVEVRL